MNTKNILIVEDDFLNRRITKKILIENGFEVSEAKNIKETMEILKSKNINLVILDINLGKNEQSGIEIATEINNKYAIPFIFLTAYDNTDIAAEAIDTMPYTYLTKPFKNIDLITSVELAIRQSYNTQNKPQTLQVKVDEYYTEIAVADIHYIESDGNYLIIWAPEKSYKIRSTIKQILSLLPAKDFIQVHRAFIINKQKVERYSTKNVVIGNQIIPITNKYVHDIDLLMK